MQWPINRLIPAEVWRDVAGCEESYDVSSHGRVRRKETGRILRPWIAAKSYHYVDLRGVKIVLKKSAGSAVKFGSSSMYATATCYALLGGLAYLAYKDSMKPPEADRPIETHRNRRMM